MCILSSSKASPVEYVCFWYTFGTITPPLLNAVLNRRYDAVAHDRRQCILHPLSLLHQIALIANCSKLSPPSAACTPMLYVLRLTASRLNLPRPMIRGTLLLPLLHRIMKPSSGHRYWCMKYIQILLVENATMASFEVHLAQRE